MVDQSHLDKRYFVDDTVYNCPFCNRRNVAYGIFAKERFDWSNDKECHAYFTECHSCGHISMHLSWVGIAMYEAGRRHNQRYWRFGRFEKGVDVGEALDEAFFFSVPSSFFVMDDRVPKVLRELMAEAEGCLKSNFLTGASACARKLVYELAVLEKAEGDNYDDRLKTLKVKRPEVDPAYFDTLLTIQQATSAKVHENSYDGWEARHLRVILAALSEALQEMYVIPEVRKERRREILALKDEVTAKKAPPKAKLAKPTT